MVELNPTSTIEGPPAAAKAPQVGVIMGSKSDWATLRHAADILTEFAIPHECRVVSAHRTPDQMRDYARSAAARGLRVIIAGAGGAAHLPGMVAAQTTLPVLGVPAPGSYLQGMDALLSIVQMPAGVPVGALAIGEAGAKNAALLAIRFLAAGDPVRTERVREFQQRQAENVLRELAL